MLSNNQLQADLLLEVTVNSIIMSDAAYGKAAEASLEVSMNWSSVSLIHAVVNPLVPGRALDCLRRAPGG